MDAKDLVIDALYLYEGRPVRLVRTRVFHTGDGDKTMAIIATAQYPCLWVKPDELEACADLRAAIDVC